jgi:lysyl endopeptidase
MRRMLIAALLLAVGRTSVANDGPAVDPAAALQSLREDRGKAGEVRFLPTPVTVTRDAPGSVKATEESTYLAVHLRSLVLRNGARIRLLDGNGKEVWRREEAIAAEDLWLPPVSGELAMIRCDAPSSECDCHAVADRFARGFERAALPEKNKPELTKQQICGTCELQDTVCPLPAALASRKKAVVRLLLGGTDTCTGFLVGDQGHLLTNVHCIANEAEARNTVFEFNAEEAECNADCTVRKAPAERFQRGATWVGSDPSIDVAIVKLPSTFAAQFGSLKLRKSTAGLNESLGIVQHPLGESRKFSIDNVRSTSGSPCGAGLPTTFAYNADTLPGSSGSPVISLQGDLDNAVIAVHECFGCPNRGVPSELVFRKLGHLLPASAFVP